MQIFKTENNICIPIYLICINLNLFTWHIAAAAVLLLLAASILFTAAAVLIFSEVAVRVVGVTIFHFGVCVYRVGPL